MYSPSYGTKLSDITDFQIRLGLMGPSGTGKTTSMLMFPNPVVINIDNLLLAHRHRTDVIDLPFWDKDWITNKLGYKYSNNILYPIRDAVLWFLRNEAIKLQVDQTLCLDSWTTLQAEFDKQQELEPVRTSTGAINDYGFWDKKIDFSEAVLTALKNLRCHVVVTFHEQDVYAGSSNKVLARVEPLMQGKFVKKIGLFFSDFYQTYVTYNEKKSPDGKINSETEYWWRTKSTDITGLRSRSNDIPAIVKPSFDVFKPYLEKTKEHDNSKILFEPK